MARPDLGPTIAAAPDIETAQYLTPYCPTVAVDLV